MLDVTRASGTLQLALLNLEANKQRRSKLKRELITHCTVVEQLNSLKVVVEDRDEYDTCKKAIATLDVKIASVENQVMLLSAVLDDCGYGLPSDIREDIFKVHEQMNTLGFRYMRSKLPEDIHKWNSQYKLNEPMIRELESKVNKLQALYDKCRQAAPELVA